MDSTPMLSRQAVVNFSAAVHSVRNGQQSGVAVCLQSLTMGWDSDRLQLAKICVVYLLAIDEIR